ncbi:MAG TPA: hypothetical protein VGL20_07150 [Candidatus Dormibacteraeota bacterium]|jgi:hypothetical protein
MSPTAPPRYDAPIETPEELAEHTPASPPSETAPPSPPQGEVELVGRVDHSLLDALVEMHNPTMENP